jgi:hypothetical protein
VTAVRPLTWDEKWSKPFFAHLYGETMRRRVTCEAQPTGRCVAGATVLRGRRRLCRTHNRMAEEGRL